MAGTPCKLACIKKTVRCVAYYKHQTSKYIQSFEYISQKGMNPSMSYAVLILGVIVGVTSKSIAATPLSLGSDNCTTTISRDQAEDLLRSITPVLDNIMVSIADQILQISSVKAATLQPGPYLLDKRAHPCRSLTVANSADCIARSVYRLKCEVYSSRDRYCERRIHSLLCARTKE